MVDFTKAYIGQVNQDLLKDELAVAGFTEYIIRPSDITVLNVLAEDETTLDTLLANHDHTQLSSKQQAELDAEASRDDVTGTSADNAIAQIDADIATLDGSPTNAQLIAILRRALQRDRKTILYLKRNG